jgi:O-antigen/teichoic acid export membrane protein
MKNRREITDILFLTALQGVNYLFPLLVFPYLAVTLGAEKFGYIGFATSVTQYMTVIVDFGFNFSATKRIVAAKENRQEINKIFTATLCAKGILLITSYILLIIISLISKFAIYRSVMWIMSLVVVGNALSFIWLFQGLGKIRMVSIFTMLAKLLILPLTFIFVKNSEDYPIAAFLQALIMIFAAIITIFYISKNKMAAFVKITKRRIAEEFKESFPIFMASFFITIYTILFAVILGYFAVAQEVGKYAVAEKIIRAFGLMILYPIMMVFYPKISELSRKAPEEAAVLIRKILIGVIVLSIIIFIVLFLFSNELMQLLGKDYEGTALLFKIMAAIPFFVVVGGVCGQLGLLAAGNRLDKKHYQQIYFAAAIIAIALIALLTPLYYSLGTAAALLITEVAVCVLMFWHSRKILWSRLFIGKSVSR